MAFSEKPPSLEKLIGRNVSVGSTGSEEPFSGRIAACTFADGYLTLELVNTDDHGSRCASRRVTPNDFVTGHIVFLDHES